MYVCMYVCIMLFSDLCHVNSERGVEGRKSLSRQHYSILTSICQIFRRLDHYKVFSFIISGGLSELNQRSIQISTISSCSKCGLISSVLNQNPQRMTTGGIKILLTQKERYMEKVKLHFKHNDCNYFFLIAEPLLAAEKIVASNQAFFHCFCLFAFFCVFPHIIYLQF